MDHLSNREVLKDPFPMEMTNDQTRNWLPGKTQQIQNSQSPSEVQQEPREGGHHQARQESGGDEDISGCEGVHLPSGVTRSLARRRGQSHVRESITTSTVSLAFQTYICNIYLPSTYTMYVVHVCQSKIEKIKTVQGFLFYHLPAI